MSNDGETKNIPEANPKIEVLAGPEAQAAIGRVEDVRDLVHNLADFTFSERPKIESGMSREEIKKELERLGYPASILRSGTEIDVDALESCIQERQGAEEEGMSSNTVKMSENGEMIVATANGKPVGMIGLRRLDTVDGREVYECPRFSILPGYGMTVVLQLFKKVEEIIRREAKSKRPLMIFHSKRPSVLRLARGMGAREITFEKYMERRGLISRVSPERMAAMKKIWEEDGWEYLEADLQSRQKEGDASSGEPTN